jgi:hypothetical protein
MPKTNPISNPSNANPIVNYQINAESSQDKKDKSAIDSQHRKVELVIGYQKLIISENNMCAIEDQKLEKSLLARDTKLPLNADNEQQHNLSSSSSLEQYSLPINAQESCVTFNKTTTEVDTENKIHEDPTASDNRSNRKRGASTVDTEPDNKKIKLLGYQFNDNTSLVIADIENILNNKFADDNKAKILNTKLNDLVEIVTKTNIAKLKPIEFRLFNEKILLLFSSLVKVNNNFTGDVIKNAINKITLCMNINLKTSYLNLNQIKTLLEDAIKLKKENNNIYDKSNLSIFLLELIKSLENIDLQTTQNVNDLDTLITILVLFSSLSNNDTKINVGEYLCSIILNIKALITTVNMYDIQNQNIVNLLYLFFMFATDSELTLDNKIVNYIYNTAYLQISSMTDRDIQKCQQTKNEIPIIVAYQIYISYSIQINSIEKEILHLKEPLNMYNNYLSTPHKVKLPILKSKKDTIYKKIINFEIKNILKAMHSIKKNAGSIKSNLCQNLLQEKLKLYNIQHIEIEILDSMYRLFELTNLDNVKFMYSIIKSTINTSFAINRNYFDANKDKLFTLLIDMTNSLLSSNSCVDIVIADFCKGVFNEYLPLNSAKLNTKIIKQISYLYNYMKYKFSDKKIDYKKYLPEDLTIIKNISEYFNFKQILQYMLENKDKYSKHKIQKFSLVFRQIAKLNVATDKQQILESLADISLLYANNTKAKNDLSPCLQPLFKVFDYLDNEKDIKKFLDIAYKFYNTDCFNYHYLHNLLKNMQKISSKDITVSVLALVALCMNNIAAKKQKLTTTEIAEKQELVEYLSNYYHIITDNIAEVENNIQDMQQYKKNMDIVHEMLMKQV